MPALGACEVAELQVRLQQATEGPMGRRVVSNGLSVRDGLLEPPLAAPQIAEPQVRQRGFVAVRRGREALEQGLPIGRVGIEVELPPKSEMTRSIEPGMLSAAFSSSSKAASDNASSRSIFQMRFGR